MILWLGVALGQETPPDPATDEPRVQLVYQETLAVPEELGAMPFWRTNRYGQAVLVSGEHTFALDPAGRAFHPVDPSTASEDYAFPQKYFQRWQVPWEVRRDERSTSLEDGPDFTGGVLLTRWGSDRREAIGRLARKGLEVYAVTPPPSAGDFPACSASVPETCLASALTILKEHAGDERAAGIANSQIERACNDGVVNACFVGVSLLGEGKLASQADSCLDGDAEACAGVAGQVYAEAKLKGESSMAGERMLEHACNLGVPGACSEAASMFDARGLPHNALLMLDRACVSGDPAACSQVEDRRDLTFAMGIAKACKSDHPDPVGCITLAQFLEEKPTFAEELEIDAFEAWSHACAGGEDPACRAMAPYVDRWGMEDPRVQSAADALLRQCEQDQTQACVGAGHLLVRVDVKDERYARARSLYAGACEKGSNEGCIAGAEQSWAGTAKRLELPDAEALFRIACDRDSALGCAGLGQTLAAQKSRVSEAIAPLEKGCELGSAAACTRLGILVEEGRHTASLQPAEIYAKGCDDGEPEACFRLGRNLAGKTATSPGTPAYQAYSSACEGGHSEACEETGRAHLSRETHYEAGIAAGHFDTACDAGRTHSCRELGLLYKAGNGVPQDRRRGRTLMLKAGELEPIKHLRLGARLGFLNILGFDGEFVIPLPVGPALSVGGDFSYLPGTQSLSMTYVGPTARIYPSHAARGLYGAIGWHQFRVNAKGQVTTNTGFNGRVGVRVQKNFTFGGVEIGLASVDAPRVRELIRPIPLVVPVFGVSGGVAFL